LNLFTKKLNKQEVDVNVFVKSGFSEKLPKMQVIRARHLHAEKEVGQEIVHGQQEEGGKQEIIAVGNHTKCPQCDRIGRVVWISEDKKTAAIQCPAAHHQIDRPKSRFGPRNIPQSKTSKNMVFLVETSSLPNP
jgi:hypothetical protein